MQMAQIASQIELTKAQARLANTQADKTAGIDTEVAAMEKVIKEVREAINAGWQPLGGISVCRAENETYANTVYAQAMVTYQ